MTTMRDVPQITAAEAARLVKDGDVLMAGGFGMTGNPVHLLHALAEAGVRVQLPRGPGLVVAYRFHHLSNGGTAPDNYAVASHVLSAGVRWRLGRRPHA